MLLANERLLLRVFPAQSKHHHLIIVVIFFIKMRNVTSQVLYYGMHWCFDLFNAIFRCHHIVFLEFYVNLGLQVML